MYICNFEPTEFLVYVLLQFFYIVPPANRRLTEATSVHIAVHRYIYIICLHIQEVCCKPATSLAFAQNPGKAALSSQTGFPPLKLK